MGPHLWHGWSYLEERGEVRPRLPSSLSDWRVACWAAERQRGFLVSAPKEARVPPSLMFLPRADCFHPEPLATHHPSPSGAHCFCFSCTHFLSASLDWGWGGPKSTTLAPPPVTSSQRHQEGVHGLWKAGKGRKEEEGGGWLGLGKAWGIRCGKLQCSPRTPRQPPPPLQPSHRPTS